MSIIFTPVSITKGRKFRAPLAYHLNLDYLGTSLKLWDPINLRYAYANANYVQTISNPDPTQTQTDLDLYLDTIRQQTLAYCKSKNPSISDYDLSLYARNIISKYHPNLKPLLDQMIPIDIDPALEIEKSISWAIKLRTKPTFIYHRHAPGGKPYPPQKISDLAYAALNKKGISTHPSFCQLLQFYLDQYSLPLPTNLRQTNNQS